MTKDIIFGIYFYTSSFLSSYFIVRALSSRPYTFIEKVVFSYLLFVAEIIVSILALNFIPQGVTSFNLMVFSQVYFSFSIILLLIRKKNRLSFKITLPSVKNKLTWVVVCLFLIEVFVSLWIIYCFPIMEGDSLAYHLQSPPNWYQAKNLIFFPSNDQRTVLFPDHQNLLVLWHFLAFKNDVFIETIPYFYLILGVLAIFNLLQRLQLKPELNFVLSLLYYYVGAHLVYAKTFSGDVGVATLIIVSISMIYSYFKLGWFGYFLFFSIANGLLLGVKTSGFLSVAIIYFLTFLYEIFVHKEKSKLRILGLYFFSFFVCLSIGGFQYFQNIRLFRNPFYPKEIILGNLLNLPGARSEDFGRHGPDLGRIFPAAKALIKDVYRSALGQQFPLFYIPSMVVLGIFYLKKITPLVLLIILMPLAIAALFLFMIAGETTRYFFHFGFAGIISLGCLLKLFRSKNIEKAMFAVLVVFILLIAPGEGKSFSRIKELFLLSKKSFAERQLGELFYDSDYHFFRKNIPSGVKILYLLPENTLIYPFYGDRYENQLIYVNSSDINTVIDIMKKEKANYFLAKSKASDLNDIFHQWDMTRGKLNSLTETEVKKTVSDLSKMGLISELGSGSRIVFYQINLNRLSYD